ncbi:MAG: flagellar biosynthetic protein FliR [Simkaniaceae bacterium]|nr:flagellar biosynthetic protein FliR [Simkaniaceae bacterium]MCF7852395.1 flagellar biosynthetic protein FliR [Simkaniaceae bacterium]
MTTSSVTDSSFINYLLSFNLSPNSLLTFFILTFFRMAPIAALTPFLGGKVMPMTARAGFAIFLALVFMPMAITTSQHPLLFDPQFIGYSIKEILIGFVLSFLASMPFFAVEASGILIDYARGSSSLIGQNVLTQNQASPIGIFYNFVLIFMFYKLGGMELFFNAVMTSYEVLPIDKILPASFYNIKNDFWKLSSDILGQIFGLAIRFAAPSLVAILMAEFFLGIANRLAPQVQIAFLGMALKSLMGLLLLTIGWAFILKNMVSESLTFVKLIDQMLQKLNIP